MNALVELLTEDAILEMPPVPLWYVGRDDYAAFIRRVFAMRGVGWRMIPNAANGQPAAAAYAPDPDGGHRLHTLRVFTVTGGKIRHSDVFQDQAVFAAFDLPLSSVDGETPRPRPQPAPPGGEPNRTRRSPPP